MSPQGNDAIEPVPDHLYLIGCDARSSRGPAAAMASAQMVGFKAHNLMRMAALGLPVPPAFVLGTPYSGSDAMRARAAEASVWRTGIAALESATGRRFGDVRVPLLVSVRSGAPVSMPGMMDTLLNIGLCEHTLGGLLRRTGNPRLVWDTYRRLIRNWGELISGVSAHAFNEAYQHIAFNAQGEDVVSGRLVAQGHATLALAMPAVWAKLRDGAATLERALGDMQDIEFTVQDGQLYFLQTRGGKRSARATVRIALDMLDEGLIATDVARERTAPIDIASLTSIRLLDEDGQMAAPLAHAASANVGVTSGEIALDTPRTLERGAQGAAVVLIRRDADTADIAALQVSAGLLTRNGSRTAHAAVVARQMGKVCLVGCTDLVIDEAARTVSLGGSKLREGDPITLDGDAGAVYAGAMRTVTEPLTDLQQRLRRLRGG